MPDHQVIDLAAARAANHPAKNLRESLAEAAQLANAMQAQLLLSQLNALQDWDATGALQEAIDAHRALGRQLEFAATLARRRERLRPISAEPAGAA